MRTKKILAALTVIVCLTNDLVEGLKCNVCSNTEECKSPKKLYCTYAMSNQAVNHLRNYYLNVPDVNTTNHLNCFSDKLQTPSGPIEYKGCIYRNFQICTYSLRPQFEQNISRACIQCNTDTCNPANQITVNRIILVSAITVVTILAKYVWCN